MAGAEQVLGLKFWEGERRESGINAEGRPNVEDRELDKKSNGDEERIMAMLLGFRVGDVEKPFVAVKRVAGQDDSIVFGPGEKGNYIGNINTGVSIVLHPKGSGSYVMRVVFMMGQAGDCGG